MLWNLQLTFQWFSKNKTSGAVYIYQVCLENVQPLLIQLEWFVQHWCNLAAKESGLECTCVNNDNFTVLVSGGGRYHWVSVCTVWPSQQKITERVEKQLCTQFCVKLEQSSAESIWMIQRPQLWATGDRQLQHDNIPAHASHLVQRFLAKYQITQVTQPPYSAPSAQIWHPVTSGFSPN